MRIAITSGVIAFIVLIAGAGIGFLLLELNKANIALYAANADIRELEGQVAGKDTEIENLSDFIDEARAINAEFAARVEELQGTLAITQSNYDISLASERALQAQILADKVEMDMVVADKARIEAEKANIEAEKATIEARNTNLFRDLSELRTDYRELTAANGDLASVRSREATTQSRVDSLEAETGNLEAEIDSLEAETGSLEAEVGSLEAEVGNLETEVGSLEAEIERLQEQRRPLILPMGAVTTGWFYCTGSMYPAITCMDEGTWLSDFNPEDIVVGATISFDPDCWEEEPDDIGTAHRVKEIKVEDGIYYFWPRGDNNRQDDGCWVPEGNVQIYLTGLEKNVRPENAYLQSQVVDSRVAWLLADETYDNLLLAYCGHTDASNCSLHGNEYDVVIDAYYKMRDAYRLYACWVQSALNSKYPGHIPNACSG